jgi:uncharacterized membrane protein YjjP (DUF1212 family)
VAPVARELLLEVGVALVAAGRAVHEVEEDVRRVGAALGGPTPGWRRRRPGCS